MRKLKLRHSCHTLKQYLQNELNLNKLQKCVMTHDVTQWVHSDIGSERLRKN